MAFAVTKANDYRTAKDDPSYVKWFATQTMRKKGSKSPTILPMHVCSEEELSLFYEPRKD